MINESDRTILQNLLLTEAEKFGCNKAAIFNVDSIIFGDFFNGIDGETRPYIQITDIPTMIRKISEYLDEYNDGQKH